MIRDVVEAYDKLDKRDLRILRTIEAAHRRFEFIPHELVEKWARYRREEVRERVKYLHRLGLLRRNAVPRLGWKITAAGLDVLALHTLSVKKKVVKLSPTPIGTGKEAVVYAGETPSGFKVAVKFHRGGVSTFRSEAFFRRKLEKYRHLTQIYETRLSALAEFFALEKIFEAGGLVPEPISVSRHVVVMGYIEGVELYRYSGEIGKILDDVFYTLRTAVRLGIIHGDLSPYNILAGHRGYIIDWPQWMPATHPKAVDYLRQDVKNIAKFFKISPEILTRELVTEIDVGEEFKKKINAVFQ
ncbi:MAG: RIO1 family regulatory kinase/ATPase [Pyrobaculum sp.]